MDVRLTITNTLDDNFWGFGDLLDDLGPDATDDEKRAAILELIHEDNWSVVDPDDGAIWTVSIDGDAPDWQARAEAAENALAVESEAASALSGVIASIAEAVGIRDSEPYLSRKTLAAVKAQGERIAALEAQLAATALEWHWGDELPPGNDWYLVFDWDAEDLDFVAMQVVYYDGKWDRDLTHWANLPEAPRAKWAEEHKRPIDTPARPNPPANGEL